MSLMSSLDSNVLSLRYWLLENGLALGAFRGRSADDTARRANALPSGRRPSTLDMEAPDIFPLPAQESEYFAQTDKGHFGWVPPGKGQDIEFVVKRWRWTGSSQVVGHWPLSEDGWQEAWGYMCAEQPQLAKAVAYVVQRKTERDRALQREPKDRPHLIARGGSTSCLAASCSAGTGSKQG